MEHLVLCQSQINEVSLYLENKESGTFVVMMLIFSKYLLRTTRKLAFFPQKFIEEQMQLYCELPKEQGHLILFTRSRSTQR